MNDFSGFAPTFLDSKSSPLSMTLIRSKVMDSYSGSSVIDL